LLQSAQCETLRNKVQQSHKLSRWFRARSQNSKKTS